jgi:hypothetical protein
MKIGGIAWVAMLIVWVSGAWAETDLEALAMARVRLSTEPGVAAGCARLGVVSDDSVKDLRKKIVRAGGNTAVVSFGIADMSQIYADVFRCNPSAATPSTGDLPAGIPPPPPGPPPPPPPGPSR